MCGISGVVYLDGRMADAAPIEVMNRLQRHRGPDGEGVHAEGAIAFGHRRLAIIDPTGGHQPLVDYDAGTVLTYNGEIYNYRELRAELSPCPFYTDSDTEVLLRAYQKWGIACVTRLRGMFAFALYDRMAGKVFLVRDRLGIKPLYYRREPGRIIFASELNPVVAVSEGAMAVDPDAVAAYLYYQYVPCPATIYEGVHKLEPATRLEIDLTTGETRQERYWSLEPAPRVWNEKKTVDELDALLAEVTDLYVRSDVPFGAFLSGGIDSSMVTAYMAQALPKPVQTFSIGFPEEDLSELPWAREAAGILGTDHHERIVSSNMGLEVLAHLVRHFGEPFGDSSAVPTYYVSRAASAEVKMVLSGDGGDELFAGYHSYPALYDMAGHGRQPGLLGHLRGLFGVNRPAWSLQEAHDAQRRIFGLDDVNALTGRRWTPPPPPFFADARDDMQRLQYQDLTTYMLDDILTKVDRMSMAASLEVRVPLLDHHLVEFAFSLPLEARIRRIPGQDAPVGKYILKSLAGRSFRPEFVHRRKMGFGIPVNDWLTGPLRPLLFHMLDSPGNAVFQFVDRQAARRVVTEFEAGRGYGAGAVWVLLMLMLWFDLCAWPRPISMTEA